jgi:hypothetical protein
MNANYIGYSAAIIWVTLPLVYMATAPDWRKSRTGRALMWLLGSTAALFVLLLTGGLFRDYPLKEWVRGGVFAAVLYAGIRLSVLFVHLRIEVERRIREDQEKS